MSVAGPSSRSLRLHLACAGSLACLLVFGLGSVVGTTEISGAVLAEGQLVVAHELKKVQHPTGGLVSEVRVAEGDRVRAGDLLVKLDNSQARANLEIIRGALDELRVRRAREEAERDGLSAIAFPLDLLAREREPSLARVLAGETKLFEARRVERAGLRKQLQEQITQLAAQAKGVDEQTAAKTSELSWIGQELQGVRDLWEKKLAPFSRVSGVEREAVRLRGERGALVASLAQLRGKSAETELRMTQIDDDLGTEVGKDLSDIRGKISEYEERLNATLDLLSKVEIRAPADGVVHQLTIHNAGAVVTAQGEPILLIVPEEGSLEVEAKIKPEDVDKVQVGRIGQVRFPAMNQRVTPIIEGHVVRVSADTISDPRTGANFYRARVAIPKADARRIGDFLLLPGMPVEVAVETGSRSLASYLVKPLTDQVRHAFAQ